jgi:hypothetical protein
VRTSCWVEGFAEAEVICVAGAGVVGEFVGGIGGCDGCGGGLG